MTTATNLWVVQCGEAADLCVDTDLPAADTFGRDWCVVEAEDAESAVAAACDVEDAHETLSRLVRDGWAGSCVDRVLWHVSSPVDADGEAGLFIRYGAAPRDGRSFNHASGREEAGLSVYAAEEVDGGYAIDGAGIATPTAVFLSVQGILPYLVEGVRVGRGSDGEPLIGAYRVVCLLDRVAGKFVRGEW